MGVHARKHARAVPEQRGVACALVHAPIALKTLKTLKTPIAWCLGLKTVAPSRTLLHQA